MEEALQQASMGHRVLPDIKYRIEEQIVEQTKCLDPSWRD
jgi:hypothetical protein